MPVCWFRAFRLWLYSLHRVNMGCFWMLTKYFQQPFENVNSKFCCWSLREAMFHSLDVKTFWLKNVLFSNPSRYLHLFYHGAKDRLTVASQRCRWPKTQPQERGFFVTFQVSQILFDSPRFTTSLRFLLQTSFCARGVLNKHVMEQRRFIHTHTESIYCI